MEGQKDAYERGVAAGEIAARLAGHDKHFANINGSIEKVAGELTGVKLALQRLHDQAEARDATVAATAAALKDAEDSRRAQSTQSWSPMARVIAVVGAIVALAGLAIAYYVATRH